MKKNKCPECGRYTYREWSGDYDNGKKISPDYGKCSNCGYIYDESIKEEKTMLKRYWVQGIKNNKMQVVLKTNILNKAINKLNMNRNLFVWDCLYREQIKANYNCVIV